ncbi:MAG: DUF4079 domain-containing protein [Elainellaceae cyanobacterium]
MSIADFALILHPMLSVVFVFPLIGIATALAWQTRQRRLTVENKAKSKIPPVVGSEHLSIGRWLAAGVIGVAILGISEPIISKMIVNETFAKEPGRATFVGLMIVLTIASAVMLYRATPAYWRGIFATLTGMGLIILGCQPEVFRRGFEWYTSHYYFGVTAALLMILSVAVVPDIYKDKQKRWRRAHAALNAIAVLLFIGQGFTGARDLLEIPVAWQKPYVNELFAKQCQTQECVVLPASEVPSSPE